MAAVASNTNGSASLREVLVALGKKPTRNAVQKLRRRIAARQRALGVQLLFRGDGVRPRCLTSLPLLRKHAPDVVQVDAWSPRDAKEELRKYLVDAAERFEGHSEQIAEILRRLERLEERQRSVK